MKNDFTKLNRTRGAAIAIALLIFLLCALAGASAYIMAISNAGRYSHANEQQYYSVSSAALLLVDMMDRIEYTSQLTNYDYQRTWNYADGKHETSDGYTLTIPSVNSGVMGGDASTLRGSGLKISSVIREQCDKLVPYLNVPEEWYASVAGNAGAPTRPSQVPSVSYEFTVTVQDSSGNTDDKYGTVNCKLVMNANYDLLLTFNGGDGEYAITVYWVADVKAVQSTSEPEYVYADSAVQDENGNYTVGTMTQKRTLQVTVRWKKENVTISRGEAITNE